MTNGANTILKTIDGKTITSAGGIVVALFMGYILWQVLSDDVTTIATEVSAHNSQTIETQGDYIEVLVDLKGVIEDNNDLIKSLLLARPTVIRTER